MKEKTETEKIADVTESIRLDVEIATNEQTRIRSDQIQIVKSILGNDHNGKLNVKEAMDGIFGRSLTDDEFDTYYPIYVLGFQTGQSLVYTKMLRSLHWLLVRLQTNP